MGVIWMCFCAAILAVSYSAPTAEDVEKQSAYTNIDSSQLESYLRGKRLNNVYPITPCAAAAAAAAANVPVGRSPETIYPAFVPPEARYYAPSTYDYANSGYATNMYRLEDPYSDSREMLRYTDANFMEQIPGARFAYRTAPSAYAPLNSGASSSVYGVFPTGVGNCNLPLLFSCSPSVVAGQWMMKPETQVYGSPAALSSGALHADSFGGAAQHYQRIHANPEQALYENSAPVNKATAAHSNEKST